IEQSNVAYGSEANISQCNCHVRFTAPKADTCGATSDVRYGPKADIAQLFDDFIGAILYRLRHDDAERLRGLEVEQQLNFACLLDRKVGGFHALENTADVPASQSIGIYDATSITNQATGRHELMILINYGQRIADRQCSQFF